MMNQLLISQDTTAATSPARVSESIGPSQSSGLGSGGSDEGKSLNSDFARHLQAQGTLQENRAAQAKSLKDAVDARENVRFSALSESSETDGSAALVVAGAGDAEHWLEMLDELRTLAADLEQAATSESADFADTMASIETRLAELGAHLKQALQQESEAADVDLSSSTYDASSIQAVAEKILHILSSITEQTDESEPQVLTAIDQVNTLLGSLQTYLSQHPEAFDELASTPFDAERLHELSPQQQQVIAALLDEISQLLEDGQAVHEIDISALYALLDDLIQSSATADEATSVQLANALSVLETMLEPVQADDTEQLAKLRELLSELNQAYSAQNSRLIIVEERQGGNNLPPAAVALGEVARQLREQIQQTLSVKADSADETDAAGEPVRTRLHEQTLTSVPNELRAAVASGSGHVSGVTAAQTASGQTDAQRESSELAQTSRLSASEVARQTQQALDIIGPGASDRLRERISVMFNNRTQAAEMRLDPPDLGRLTIRLQVSQDAATVSFQVSNAQAREAIEQTLPRLRELLQEQGIQLADANVSEQGGQHQQTASTRSGESGGQADELDMADDDIGQAEMAAPVSQDDGRVDYYV